MKIVPLIPGLPVSDFVDVTVWRCIGIDARPKEVSSLAGKTDSERSTIHSFLTRLNVSREESRKKLLWSVPTNVTRYSDGNTPVVYTAKEPSTAVVERFHWALTSIGSSAPRPDICVQLEVLEIEYHGRFKDVTSQCPPCFDLVHPTDYSCCQEVGRIAFADANICSLKVPSARQLGGVNVPIFKGDHVGLVKSLSGASVFVKSSGLEAHHNGVVFDPASQDVYAQVKS